MLPVTEPSSEGTTCSAQHSNRKPGVKLIDSEGRRSLTEMARTSTRTVAGKAGARRPIHASNSQLSKNMFGH